MTSNNLGFWSNFSTPLTDKIIHERDNVICFLMKRHQFCSPCCMTDPNVTPKGAIPCGGRKGFLVSWGWSFAETLEITTKTSCMKMNSFLYFIFWVTLDLTLLPNVPLSQFLCLNPIGHIQIFVFRLGFKHLWFTII